MNVDGSFEAIAVMMLSKVNNLKLRHVLNVQ